MVQMQMEQKVCKGTKFFLLSQNEVHRDPMVAECYHLWHIIVLNCRLWPYMAYYGLSWSNFALVSF